MWIYSPIPMDLRELCKAKFNWKGTPRWVEQNNLKTVLQQALSIFQKNPKKSISPKMIYVITDTKNELLQNLRSEVTKVTDFGIFLNFSFFFANFHEFYHILLHFSVLIKCWRWQICLCWPIYIIQTCLKMRPICLHTERVLWPICVCCCHVNKSARHAI